MKILKNVYKYFIQLIVISICLTNFNGARSECSDNDWECDNGECISEEKACDGKVDCRDRSDEIAENCIHIKKNCPNFAFSCAYGACIDGKAKCNGIQDCADNSDELICTTKDESDFQGVCTDNEIQCVTSKECINSIKLCDGRKDCRDGSDESLPLCINFGCTPFGFQCGYGACINGNAKCNGVIECADGSDEAWELCNTPRKKTPSTVSSEPLDSCFLPNKPEYQDMIFKLHPQNQTIPLESYVQNYNSIHIECKKNFKLRGHPTLLCLEGKWNENFPTCASYCDGQLLSGLSIKAICDYKTKFRDCPKKIHPNTEIQVNCAYGYTRTDSQKTEVQYLKCLSDGKFDIEPLRCQQNCGRVTSNVEELSKNGIPIEASMAPWHVGIYESDTVNYIYICSGSIVSPRVVITAAHCFWDQSNLIVKNNVAYQIIAGRSISNYTTEHKTHSQLIDVTEIIVPDSYRGKRRGQKDDIAFVKLKSELRYSETIAPICIPKELPNTSKYVPSKQHGLITGFGEHNQLQRLNMTTLSYHECSNRSPIDSVVADDKFCIYSTEGGSVCRGDSGGGFFRGYHPSDELGPLVYKILGVISNTPYTQNDCTRSDETSYVAITNIQYMAEDFKTKLKAAIEEDQKLF
ncbi:modular serine protease-like [Cochliomyia hominivorax]